MKKIETIEFRNKDQSRALVLGIDEIAYFNGDVIQSHNGFLARLVIETIKSDRPDCAVDIYFVQKEFQTFKYANECLCDFINHLAESRYEYLNSVDLRNNAPKVINNILSIGLIPSWECIKSFKPLNIDKLEA